MQEASPHSHRDRRLFSSTDAQRRAAPFFQFQLLDQMTRALKIQQSRSQVVQFPLTLEIEPVSDLIINDLPNEKELTNQMVCYP